MGQHGKHGHLVNGRAAAALLALAAPSTASACATALALGLDVSYSVDAAEHRLQTGGLAAAFRHPDVIDAILSADGVMVAVYEWSGFFQQDVIIGWTWLGDQDAIEAFAQRIDGHRRGREDWPTALGRAVEFAARLHDTNPRDCARRVIDISGDGVNNHGVAPDWYARRGVLDGFTVNGLAIRGSEPDPAEYYRRHLIHGPGAFVETADGYEDFPRAIVRKLVRELAAPLASRATAPVTVR